MTPGFGPTSRRTLLAEAAALGLCLMVPGAKAIGAVSPGGALDDGELQRLVKFLTGRADVSAQFARRAYAALVAEQPALEQRLRALLAHIDQSGPADVGAFKAAAPAGPDGLLAAALALVGALYLGYVSGPDGGRLVSYEDALMWRPTADVTLIPSYAPGPPGWWTDSTSPDKP